MRRLRASFCALSTFIAVTATAASTDFRVLVDVDRDVATGCTVSAMEGVDQVFVTRVEDDGASARVTRTFRMVCEGGALGAEIDVEPAGWPASFQAANGDMVAESRIRFSELSSSATSVPHNMRIAVEATRGTSTHTALTRPDGSPVQFPPALGRRRAVTPPGEVRVFTLDGLTGDWQHIDALFDGIASGGTSALRIVKVFAFANVENNWVYFRFDANVSDVTPFAADDAYRREPGQGLTVTAPGVLANDGDPHGLPLTAKPVSPASRGTVTLNADGSFTYTPSNPSGTDNDSFEYRASNGTHDSNAARVRISVRSGVNAPPDGVADAFDAVEDVALSVAAPGVLQNDSDADGDALAATLVTPPAHGTLTFGANGSFTYTPAPDFFGEDSFVYRVSDGTETDAATVTITISSVNDAPVVARRSFTIPENRPNGTSVGRARVTDADDGDAHQWTISGGNTGDAFAIDATRGEITIANTNLIDFEGNAEFVLTVRATDDGTPALSGTNEVTISVSDVNDAPIVFGLIANVQEDTPAELTLEAFDPEGAPLTYTVLTNPLHGTLTGTPPNLTYTPHLNSIGTDEFTFRANDGTLDSAVGHVGIFVHSLNDAPAITSPPAFTTPENLATVGTVTATDVELSPVAYSISGGADAALFSMDAVSGALTFNTAPDFETPGDTDSNNIYEVTVAASDGTDATAQNLTITVTDANEAPVFTSASAASVPENTTSAFAAAATDPEGMTVAYAIGGGADAALFSIDATTGVVSFLTAPDFEAPADSDGNNVYSIVISASDGSNTPLQTVTITVTDVNEPPAFTSANTASVVENTSTAVLTVAAADPEGTPLTYAITGGADGADFTVDASTGALTFNVLPDFEAPADADANNEYLAEVTAADGVNSIAQTITVTVTNTDEAPVFTSASAVSVPENTTSAFAAAATDPEGMTVAYAIGGGVDAALFSIDATTGAVSFLTAPDFEAPADSDGNNIYSIVISASDGSNTPSQTVTITITDVNEPPVFTSANTASVVENTSTAVLTVAAADPEGTPLTYAITGGADGADFTVDASTGALTFNVLPDFEAPADADANNNYLVEVTAGDGLNSIAQTITVTVTNADEAPVFTSATAVSVPENTISAFAAAATDPEGMTVAYAIGGGVDAALFSIDATTGAVSFLTAPDFEGPADSDGNNVYSIVISANDGSNTPSQTVTITITDVNEPPVFTSANTASVVENTSTAVLTVAAADPERTPLTYAITGGVDAAHFIVDASTGALTFTLLPDFEAPADADANNEYLVEVTAGDGLNSIAQTITVTVTNADDAPVFTSATAVSVPENTTSAFAAAATDPEGMTVAYAIGGGVDAALFSIDATTGAVSFLTAPDFEAPGDSDGNNVYSIVISANDGSNTPSQTVTITVTDVNEPPVFTSANTATVVENTSTAVLTVAAADPEGTPLTYAITGGVDAAHFTVDASTGALTFTLLPDFEAPADADANNEYLVEVTAGDGLNSIAQTITVTVTDGNDAPVFTTGTAFAAAENTTAITTVAATDEDGDAPQFVISGGVDAGFFSIDSTTGALTFASPRDFESPADAGADNVYDVQVSATDGSASTSQDLTVTITNADEVPVFTSASLVTVGENTSAAAIVVASDPEGQAVVYSLTGGADVALFTINLTNGALAFISAPDFEAPADANADNDYVVQVTANDGALSALQTITITVTDTNEAPAFTSANAVTIPENSTVATTVTASDAEGDTLTFSIAGGPDQARFAIDASTGALSFTVPPDFENPTDADSDSQYVVDVRVSDGTNQADQTITVTVTPVNEAPFITSPATATVAENQTSAIDLQATDPENDTLTYSITGGADGSLFAADPTTGVLTFNAPPDFDNPADAGVNNDYVVEIQVFDGVNSTNQTITITVTDENEAPTITSANTALVPENSTAVLTVTSTDAEANAIAYSVSGGADGSDFAIDANTGALAFIGAPDFENPADADLDNQYVVEVTANDGVNSVAQIITVTVTNVNEAPTVTSASTAAVAENSTAVLTATATDPENNTVTWSLTGGADAPLFAIDANTGALAFIAPPDFEAPADANSDNDYVLEITASDGTNGVSQAINVTVTNVNEAPVITAPAGPLTVDEDNSLLFPGTLTIADVDAGSNSVTVTLSATNGTLALSGTAGLVVTGENTSSVSLTGTVSAINTALDNASYTPFADYVGTDTILVGVDDLGNSGSGTNLTDAASIDITIAALNDAPALDAIGSTSVAEDASMQNVSLTGISAGPLNESSQTVTITATSSDPSVVPDPSVGAVAGGAATLSYAPAADAFGTVTITVTARDDGPDTIAGNADDAQTTRTFDIEVRPVNDVPTLDTIDDSTVNEDGTATDVALTGISAGLPANEAGQGLTISATSSDPSIVPNPTIGAIAAGGATLSFTPVADQHGSVTITVTLVDDGGTTDAGVDTIARAFTVTVSSVNDAPTLDAISNVSVDEGAATQQVSLTGIGAGAANESGQSLTISATSSDPSIVPDPTIGAISAGGATLSFTPLADAFGTVTITVTLQDDGLTANSGVDTTTRTFDITVDPINDQPTLDAIGDQTVLEDAASTNVSLTGITAGTAANETGQTLTISATSSDPTIIPDPSIGPITAGAATLSFAPVANANGSVTITVTLSDDGTTANGGVDTIVRTFTVDVTAVNDQPELDAIGDQIVAEDSGTTDVALTGISAGPPNESGQNLNISATSSNPSIVPDPAIAAVAGGAATLSFTPVGDATGMVTITVTVQDDGLVANGGVDVRTRTFTITVNSVNDAPVLTASDAAAPHVEGGGAVAAVGAVTITDVDDTNIELATVAITGNLTNGADSLSFNNAATPAISGAYSNTNGVLTLTGSAPLSDYATALQNVRYNNTADHQPYPTRTITWTVHDGTNPSAPQTTTLTVQGVNNAPVVRFPLTFSWTTKEDTTLTLPYAAVWFDDREAENAPLPRPHVRLSLTATNGVMTLGTTNGLNFAVSGGMGDGVADAQMVFEGTVIDLRIAMYGLQFIPTPELSGTGSIQFVIDDLGIAPAPAKTDTEIRNIPIASVNDAPTLTIGGDQTVLDTAGSVTVPGFATGISAGPANESAQMLTLTVSHDNPGLFSLTPSINLFNGDLTFTTNPGVNGVANVTVTLADDGGTANGGVNETTRTFVITVNQVPVFTSANSTTLAVGQASSFDITANARPNATLALEAGSLPTGLTFTDDGDNTARIHGTPATGTDATYNLTIRATNAEGFTDQAFTLIVTCPVVTFTPAAGALPDATYNVAYTRAIDVGTPGYTYAVTAGALPSGINLDAANGGLSGTPTTTGNFSFTITATETASGCTTDAAYTLAVLPAANADSYGFTSGGEAVGNTQVVVAGHSTPTTPFVAFGGSLLANDSAPAGVTVTGGTFAIAGGSVTIAADGSFTYTPSAGFTGDAVFNYTINSNGTSAVGTATVRMANKVWYVRNNAGAGGTGRSHQPFNTLAAAVAASGVNDLIFIYRGDGSTTGLSGNFVMKNGQTWQGEAAALTMNGHALVPAGSRPTLSHTAAAVNLATGVTLKGLAVATTGNGSVEAANGVNLGTSTIEDVLFAGSGGLRILNTTGALTVSDSTINTVGNGNGVLVSGGSRDITFTNTTITHSGSNTVWIQSTTGGTIAFNSAIAATTTGGAIGVGVLSAANTTINFNAAVTATASSGTTGTGISISGSSGTTAITFAGAVTTNTPLSTGLSVANNTGGTIAFNAAKDINGGSQIGLFIDNNAGATVTFANGGLTIDTTTGTGAYVVGGGAITISGTGNTINSSAGTALDVRNGSQNLTFQRLDSGGGTYNLQVQNCTGTLDLGTGAFSGAVSYALHIFNGAPNVSYDGTINAAGMTKPAFIYNLTGGTLNFGGAVTSTADGMVLQTNTGGTVNFNGAVSLTTGANTAMAMLANSNLNLGFLGGLTISTGNGHGFVASNTSGGNARVRVTGGVNDITTTGSGIALDIRNTVVDGATGAHFRNVSATGASTMSGIVLSGNMTGTVSLSGTVQVSNRSVSAIDIDGSGHYSFGPTTVSGRTGHGIEIDNSIGTIAFGATTINDGGLLNAVDINGSSVGSISFSSLNIPASGAAGLSLTNVNAAVIVSGGEINGCTGADVAVSGGSGNLTFGASITDDVGALVTITNTSGGTKTFSGAISDGNDGDGGGIALTNNGGATVSFSGGLVLSTTGTIPFSASGGGTVNVSGTGNIVSASGATAVSVVGTSGTHMGGALAFRSVSSSNATKGITVQFYDGSFTVSGDGVDGDSLPDSVTDGGTISGADQRGAEFVDVDGPVSLNGMTFTNSADTAGPDATVATGNCGSVASGGGNTACFAGIHFDTVSNVSLHTVTVNGSGQMGINGNAVTNLTMKTVLVLNAGTSEQEDGIRMYNLGGTGSMEDVTITDPFAMGINLENTTASLASEASPFLITRAAITGSTKAQGATFHTVQTGVAHVKFVEGSISGHFGVGIQTSSDVGATGTLGLYVDGTSFSDVAGAIHLQAGGGTHKFDIRNIDMIARATGSSHSINVKSDGSGVLTGKIYSNTIGGAAAFSGAPAGSFPITVDARNSSVVDAEIRGNTIRHGEGGIEIGGGQGSSKVDLTITGNRIYDPEPSAFAGILANSGISNTDSSCMTVQLGGLTAYPGSPTAEENEIQNRVEGTWPSGSIRVIKSFGASPPDPVFNLPGYDGTGVNAWITARNSIGGSAVTSNTGAGGAFTSAASCP